MIPRHEPEREQGRQVIALLTIVGADDDDERVRQHARKLAQDPSPGKPPRAPGVCTRPDELAHPGRSRRYGQR